MHSKLRERAHVVIGVFVLSCLGASFLYGWFPLIVMVVGLVVFPITLNAFDPEKRVSHDTPKRPSRDPGKRGSRDRGDRRSPGN